MSISVLDYSQYYKIPYDYDIWLTYPYWIMIKSISYGITIFTMYYNHNISIAWKTSDLTIGSGRSPRCPPHHRSRFHRRRPRRKHRRWLQWGGDRGLIASGGPLGENGWFYVVIFQGRPSIKSWGDLIHLIWFDLLPYHTYSKTPLYLCLYPVYLLEMIMVCGIWYVDTVYLDMLISHDYTILYHIFLKTIFI